MKAFGEAQYMALDMARLFFEDLRVHTSIVNTSELLSPSQDLGLRSHLFTGNKTKISDLYHLQDAEGKVFDPERKYFAVCRDRFGCFYCLVPLPSGFSGDRKQDADTAGEPEKAGSAEGPLSSVIPDTVFLGGPFLREAQTLSGIRSIADLFHVPAQQRTYLIQYFATLTTFSENNVIDSILHALARSLYGEGTTELIYTEESRAGSFQIRNMGAGEEKEDVEHEESTWAKLQARYDQENRMMDCIAEGNAEGAIRIMEGSAFSSLEVRSPSKLRSEKNYGFVLGTLCRKAAERAGIHPIYIDSLSRKIMMRIEEARSPAEMVMVRREIIRRYCFLVLSKDTRSYSLHIRRAVHYIEEHYAQPDLTLASLARILDINKCYLSTTFRKETGKTVTEYLNELRIARAVRLLNTTADSLQEIAVKVGIPNVNYFSRLFKKSRNITPSAYRKMLLS